MENINLLLVDDEKDFRGILSKRLGKRGFVPAHASSGEECLSILEEKSMDVVVLDVKMPGMSGIEVLDVIKRKHPGIEVILLTGHETIYDGVEGIKAGAFDYLTKPVEFEHLLGKIKQAYDKIKREEEKQKETEFKTKIEHQMIATERLASLGTLSTGVAHEINNPLAIINEAAGFMKLVLSREELSGIPRKKDLENALDKIERGVDRAKQITHQLLGFVKKQESVFTEIDLKGLLNETHELVGKKARDKEIEIVFETGSSKCVIWSDPYEIRQVLINLLVNAIDATGKNGVITIILKDIDDGVALTIADTGEGIPKENLEKIFEPFYTTKPTDMGTGLGLYVTRGIVSNLGGTLEVESSVGHGTSFCIKLHRSHEIESRPVADKNIFFDILNKIKGDDRK